MQKSWLKTKTKTKPMNLPDFIYAWIASSKIKKKKKDCQATEHTWWGTEISEHSVVWEQEVFHCVSVGYSYPDCYKLLCEQVCVCVSWRHSCPLLMDSLGFSPDNRKKKKKRACRWSSVGGKLSWHAGSPAPFSTPTVPHKQAWAQQGTLVIPTLGRWRNED